METTLTPREAADEWIRTHAEPIGCGWVRIGHWFEPSAYELPAADAGAHAGRAIADAGSVDPEDWLPKFFERLDQTYLSLVD